MIYQSLITCRAMKEKDKTTNAADKKTASVKAGCVFFRVAPLQG
ncbi:hypothetical protein GCM10007086_20550 [Photobacterium aphoticum]|nr:hypothetical protein GCM10007086_20550 [Photobacterium aphoticum]